MPFDLRRLRSARTTPGRYWREDKKMRRWICPLALLAAIGLAACGAPETKTSNSETKSTATTNTNTTTTTQKTTGAPPDTGAPPISSAHGSGSAATAPAGSSASEKPGIDTATLDAKIEKAEAKAKLANASEADKRAAAAAYVERGRIFYDAGQPRLYKFALGDFRRALRYQPDNAEARDKMEMIVSIYQSMGRPVPTNGLEAQ
jgi:hypothetical protein